MRALQPQRLQLGVDQRIEFLRRCAARRGQGQGRFVIGLLGVRKRAPQRDQPRFGRIERGDVIGEFFFKLRKVGDRDLMLARGAAQREQPLLDPLQFRRIEFRLRERPFKRFLGETQRIDRLRQGARRRIQQLRRLRQTPLQSPRRLSDFPRRRPVI